MKTLPPPELVRDLPDGIESSVVLPVAAKSADIARIRNELPRTDGAARVALLTRLSHLCERWDLQQSLDAAREAAADPGADAAALERLGEVSERAGDFVTASESLARAAELSGPTDAMPLLLRSAVFAARAGRFGETERLLLQARALRGNDSLTFELLGELAGAMSDDGHSPSGAASYLLAAELSRSTGERDKELFSLRRAYALDRRNIEVATRLAELLAEAGQPEVADEILREVGPLEEIVTLRLGSARVKPELWLYAALDLELDLEPFALRDNGLFAVLAASGAWEVLALFHETRAHELARSVGIDAKVAHLVQAAQIWAGPLANPERALWLTGEALVADPSRVDALDLLVGWAGVDLDVCVHVLLRVLGAESAPAGAGGDPQLEAGRARCARELFALAERAERPTLAAWALLRLSALSELTADEARELEASAGARDQARGESMELLRSLDRAEDPADKRRLLAQVLQRLADVPDLADIYERAVRERLAPLQGEAALDPDAVRLASEAYGLAWRRSDVAECLALLRRHRPQGHPELFLAEWHARRSGDAALVVEHVRRGLTLGAPLGAAAAWVEACLRRDRGLRAEALVAHAEHAQQAALRAALWTVAAQEEMAHDSGLALSLVRAARGTSTLLGPVRLAAALENDAAGRRSAERELFLRWPDPERGLALAGGLLDAPNEPDTRADIAPVLTQALRLRPSHASTLLAGFELARRADTHAACAAVVDVAIGTLLPASALTASVAGMIGQLGARDGARSVTLALRALDALGPTALVLRNALLELAEKSRRPELAAATLARVVDDPPKAGSAPRSGMAVDDPPKAGSAGNAGTRIDRLLELATVRGQAGDLDGEAYSLSQAVLAGATGDNVLQWVERLLRVRARLSGDPEVLLLTASAALADARKEPARSVRALRALFEATWRTLGDHESALAIARRAVVLAPELAPRAFGSDLVAMLGARDAATSLRSLAEQFAGSPFERGSLLAESARAFALAGEQRDAFFVAVSALQDNPSRTFALELAERTSAWAGSVDEMSPLYTHVAESAKGRFGRRAAHYRGARFFDARGLPELSLRHMARAFQAVPSDGTALAALTRAASRSPDALPAVRVLEDIAGEANDPAVRASWLLRAAELLAPAEAGAPPRREDAPVRFDLALRALSLHPAPIVARAVAAAAEACAATGPDGHDLVTLRLERAIRFVLRDLEGPDGARMALLLVPPAHAFCGAPLAFDTLAKAIATAGDLEEFAGFRTSARALVQWDDPPAAVAALCELVESCAKPFTNIGREAAQVMWEQAQALEEAGIAASETASEPSRLRRAVFLAGLLLAERPSDDDHLKEEEDQILLPDLEARASALGISLEEPDEAPKSSMAGRPEVRFAKIMTPERRTSALVTEAMRLELSAPDRALELAERAHQVLGARGGPRLATLRSRLYSSRGEAERALVADYTGPGDEELCDHLTRHAARAEMEGELRYALAAWQRVAALDPTGVERWVAVERVAEIAGDDAARVSALEHMAKLLDGVGRRQVEKRLARTFEQIGAIDRADGVWTRLYEGAEGQGTLDEDVDLAVERRIARSGDKDELARHLSRRAGQMQIAGGLSDAVRAVRLRRIAMLEQQLGRTADALTELRALAADYPRSHGTLRYLADLLERTGSLEESLTVWQRLLAMTPQVEDEAGELELHVASLLTRTGHAEAAHSLVSAGLQRAPQSADLLALQVDALRALGRTGELGDTLELYADSLPDGDPRKTIALLQASQCAARIDNMYLALNRAERASTGEHAAPEAVLLTAALEYRLRGAGTPDEARVMAESLADLETRLGPEDAALRSFLLAEAFDVMEGHGAGYRELLLAKDELGPSALLYLGLAERHAKRFQFEEALRYFERAQEGELYGMRRAGEVALAAADAAFRLHEMSRGWEHLERAYQDPKLRHAALKRMFHVAVETSDVARATHAAHAMVALAAPDQRLERTQELGRLLLACDHEVLKGEGARLLEQVMNELPAGAKKDDLRATLGRSPVPHRLAFHEMERIRRPSEAPAPMHVVNDARARLEQGDDEAIVALEEAARAGSADAAEALADHYDRKTTITHSQAPGPLSGAPPSLGGSVRPPVSRVTQDPAVLRYRLHAAALSPLDRPRIERLRRAALADHNPTFARALDHVQRSFDPAGGLLPPPPLVVQSEQPGFTALLAGGYEPLLRAHGELWATAGPQILYALRGKDAPLPRHPLVPLPPASAAAALLEVSLRLLNAPKANFCVLVDDPPKAGGAFRDDDWVAQDQGELGFDADLEDVPRVWLRGPLAADSAELRYCLGFALAAIFPENSMLLALPEAEGQIVYDAVWQAFGPNANTGGAPPSLGKPLSPKVAPLVDLLWQTVPGRVQRHAQVLLEKEPTTTYAEARRRAKLSGLRLALFLTGDFGFTVRRYVEGLGHGTDLGHDALVALFGQRRELLELYLLALRPEYADARWQDPTTAQRNRLSSGMMRTV